MRNRYGDEYSFEKLADNVYRIVGDLKYWRFGGLEGQDRVMDDNLGFVDPSGGPFISHGYMIEGRPVTRIFVDKEHICFEVL